ncbi:MAG: ABC transporter permease [Pseudomonadota bacterium]
MRGTRISYLYPISIFIGLVIWEIAVWDLPRVIMASPSMIAFKLVDGVASGAIPRAFAGSLAHLGLGYALAVAVGVPFGFLIGRSRTVFYALDPVINAIYAIPPVAFVPFIVIWFGLFFEARVVLVFGMSVIEILVTISVGARSVERAHLDVARSFGARGLALTIKVVVPAVVPFVFTGLRIGLVRAIHAMIIAELFLAAVNLGSLMKQAALRFDTGALLAVVVVLAVFGLIVQEGLRAIEARLLPWHVRN